MKRKVKVFSNITYNGKKCRRNDDDSWRKRTLGLVKYPLYLMMLLVMIVLLTLPIAVRMYLEAYFFIQVENYYWFLVVFLWVSGLLYLGIVYELRRMFKSLNQRESFIRENVASFKR